MFAGILCLILIVQKCSCVFYRLNDESENAIQPDGMPPLYNLDQNYDRCLKQKGGLYCVAKFELDADPNNQLINAIRKYSQDEIKHYNHTLIDRAVCVTQTCKKYAANKTLHKTEDLRKVLEGCINETIWAEYGLEAKLTQIYSCDKYDDPVITDLADWAFAAVLLCLLAMNVVGSVCDVWYDKKEGDGQVGNPYLLSFSIFRNWKQFSGTVSDPRFDRMRGLHGLKAVITFFIASSHIMWLVGTGYTDNPEEFEQSHGQIHYQVIFSGMVIVQIFFVISGCLLVFNLQIFSETNRLTWKLVWKILLFRWARLTPGNAIMIFFTATWLRHLGSGPLWKMNVVSVATDCRNHWWKHLLYFNNYVKQDKVCAVQSWHVAAEMQLFTLGLMVYAATVTRRRYLALAVLGLIGMAGPALHVWLQDLDALVIHKPEFYRTFENDTYRSMHVLSHNNLTCYAIGMAIGLIAYYCVKNKIEYSNSKLLKYLTWCVPPLTVAVFLSGAVFYTDGERPHVLVRMAYAGTQRATLGVLVAFMILNFVLKFENAVRGFLEWPGWMVASRLSYTVYLLHVNIIHIILGARTQLGHVSFFYVVLNHFGVVSLTLAASIPFYLLLEAPMKTLLKTAFTETSETKQTKIKKSS